MKHSKRAGISLVALVITIIVLIILTAAVIVTFMEGGIVERAKEAVFKNDIRTYQEILAVKKAEEMIEISVGTGKASELNGTTAEEIQAIIPEFKDEYEGLVVVNDGEVVLGEREEEPYTTWLTDLGIGTGLPQNSIATVAGLDIGDYVVYSPDGSETSYEILATESGYFNDANSNYRYDEGEEYIDQTISRQSINWRVLKNDGIQVTLISETPIDNIGLGKQQGFLNGPEILDEMYGTIYSGSKGTARNLKAEDVNEAMGVTIGEDVKPWYNDTSNTKIELGAGATFGDVLDATSYDVSSWSMPDDNYRNYELYYGYKGSNYQTEENSKAYEIIFRTVDGTADASKYWLSSPCVGVHLGPEDDVADFNVRFVSSGGVYADGLYYSADLAYGSANAGRPIVVLNSNVEVVDETAGGDTLETAWQLK